MLFYICTAVISVCGFTADMILRYMEKIRSFGMEARLHRIKGKTIPIEDFIPHNITLLTVFFSAFGVAGILLKLIELNGFVVFPIAVMCGMFANFFTVRLLKRLRSYPIPEYEDLSGCEAFCAEDIASDGYGIINVKWNGRRYFFTAVPANENDFSSGDRVVILYRTDGVCFIEKPERLTEILNEPQ